jgi:hypothetical protein
MQFRERDRPWNKGRIRRPRFPASLADLITDALEKLDPRDNKYVATEPMDDGLSVDFLAELSAEL